MTYVIQQGDSLWSIAARFGVTVQAIAAANQITTQQMLYVGQTLIIPTVSSPTPPGPAVPPVSSPVSGTMDERIARLEREFNQVVTIVDQHRRQMADLGRRVQKIEQQ